MRSAGIAFIAIGFLASCSGSEPADPAEQETVFDPMVETLERAEAVDELQRTRMDNLNEQLQQAEDGAEDP